MDNNDDLYSLVDTTEGIDDDTGPHGTVFINNTSYSGADIKLVVHVYDTATTKKDRQEQINLDLEAADARGVYLLNKMSLTETTLASTHTGSPEEQLLRRQLNKLRTEFENLNFSLQALNEENKRLQSDGITASTLVLADIQTISISTHRDKRAVRALGKVYPVAFSRGQREIASNQMYVVSAPPQGATTYPDSLTIGWDPESWGGTTPFQTTLYYDNIYIDNSWARVEIGDAATYDTCTHREIQIPTSWADEAITFTVNQGSFADESEVYLFVIDESGVASAGLPITLGASGTADTTAPTVTAFTIPATSTSRTVSISSFTATDDIAVTGYLLTETVSTPSAANPNWSASAPSSYTFGTAGEKTLYAWVKDAANNISTALNAPVTITLPSQSIAIGAGSQSITKSGGTLTIIRQ